MVVSVGQGRVVLCILAMVAQDRKRPNKNGLFSRLHYSSTSSLCFPSIEWSIYGRNRSSSSLSFPVIPSPGLGIDGAIFCTSPFPPVAVVSLLSATVSLTNYISFPCPALCWLGWGLLYPFLPQLPKYPALLLGLSHLCSPLPSCCLFPLLDRPEERVFPSLSCSLRTPGVTVIALIM